MMLYFLQDVVSRLLGGKSGSYINTEISKEAQRRYERLANEVSQQIPSRKLYNTEGLEEVLVNWDAEYDEDKDLWTMPAYISDEAIRNDRSLRDKWALFWPTATEDLDESGSINGRETLDGKSWEHFVHPDDLGQGSDSTATPIAYAMVPVMACATVLLMQFNAWLGVIPALFAWINIVALYQSENGTEAVKAGAMYVVTLIVGLLYSGTSGVLGMLISALSTQEIMGLARKMPIIGETGLLALPLLGAVVGGVLAWMWQGIAGNSASVMGGALTKVRKGMIVGVIAVVLMSLLMLFPGVMKVVVVASVFCFYPLIYAYRNYVQRTWMLQKNAAEVAGVVNESKRREIREKKEGQQLRAIEDDTWKFTIGTSTGTVRTQRGYPFGPPSDLPVWLSMNDMSMHMLTIGDTGQGKTTVSARPRCQEMIKARKAGVKMGMLVLCGKGALASEVRNGLDWCVRPGIKLAYFEGLTPDEVLDALMSLDPKAEPDFWTQSAADFLKAALIILSALIENEKFNINNAAEQITRISKENAYILTAKRQLVKTLGAAWNEGLPEVLELNERQRDLSRQMVAFRTVIETGRTYFWTPQSLEDMRHQLAKVKRRADGNNELDLPAKKILAHLGYRVPGLTKERTVERVHPRLAVAGSALANATAFFVDQWVKQPEETAGSILGNVNTWMNQLISTEDFSDGTDEGRWSMTEHGMDITEVFRGKFVGVDLKTDKYPSARIVMLLLMKRIHKYAKARADVDWRSVEGETDMLYMMDECHFLMTDEIAEMASIFRSLGVSLYFLTQDIESFMQRYNHNKDKAMMLLNKFANFMALKCSPASYEFLARKIGQSLVIDSNKFQLGIDYDQALMDYSRATVNIEDHPNRALLQKMKDNGFGKIITESDRRSALRNNNWGVNKANDALAGSDLDSIAGSAQSYVVAATSPGYTYGDIFNQARINEALEGTSGRKAFVILQRAGAPRVDVIRTYAVKPQDILSLHDDETTIEQQEVTHE
ncbi:TraM recognition domain-containing protein [Stenotrophomonas geniculata]|uniref:TraM recognition domain-containing protein n=1 Tax=Stenotrophomonas geniculata TaxID=86188 RepID=UPI003AAC5E40